MDLGTTASIVRWWWCWLKKRPLCSTLLSRRQYLSELSFKRPSTSTPTSPRAHFVFLPCHQSNTLLFSPSTGSLHQATIRCTSSRTATMAQIRGTAGYNLGGGGQNTFGGPSRGDTMNDPSPLDAIREQTGKIEDFLDTLSDPVKPYVCSKMHTRPRPPCFYKAKHLWH